MEATKCVDCVATHGADVSAKPLFGEIGGKRYCRSHYDNRKTAIAGLERVNKVNQQLAVREEVPSMSSETSSMVQFLGHVARGVLLGTYSAQQASAVVNSIRLAKDLVHADRQLRKRRPDVEAKAA